ncbi:glycosyltransferase [Rhodoblastus sp.]|uniref:glycosyltransferase n=1 Tax=Rhodoblastus sp. TaxID=1962975 RepID=UPI00260FD340|nr:glycosyltransferase [Rhodoblastus sp.]
MRIVVYPHTMELGGSQLNAIQLAGAVRDRGHEVIVLSEPGPLVDRVRAMGMEHIEIPADRRRPSPEVIGKLVRLVRDRRVDLVHGYEWPPIVEALVGLGFRRKTPVVGTVMAMSVAPFLPRTVPLAVGTEQIRKAAVAAGHRRVMLLEPPVDTDADNPSVDGEKFRARYGIEADEVVVAMICRLVPELKLEGLLAACDAVGELALAGRRVRLIIVGDGLSRDVIAERASRANATVGRQVVLLTGEIADPRPAYAAADITVGQGGSALRGMAFGKPLVVVGERGFSELLTPESAPIFLQQGWYGLGPGSLGLGAPALRLALDPLVHSLDLRQELGGFARQLVLERFSLRQAAQRQEEEYFFAIQDRVALALLAADLARCMNGLLISKVRRKYERWRGTIAIDDSNALSVVAEVLAGGASNSRSGERP